MPSPVVISHELNELYIGEKEHVSMHVQSYPSVRGRISLLAIRYDSMQSR